MICNSCGRGFPDKFEICPYCGFKKPQTNETINSIKQNINYLKNLKNYFEQAVLNIENSLNQIEKTLPRQPQPVIRKTPQPVYRMEKKEKEPFIEKFLGEKFLLTIGIIAVLFASAFFLKYSFENNLFNPVFRVTVTTLAGLGFILTGYYLKSKNKIFGVILITAGIALLFFSNFASLVLYRFYGTITAFTINLILVGCSLFLAIKFESQWVSIIGIGGAYLTPLSLKTAISNDIGFFTYLLALSFAPLFLAFKKKWNAIIILANSFTVMWFYIWYYYFNTNPSIYLIFFIIWFYIVFLLSTVFYFKEKEKSLFVLSPLIAMFFYPLISIDTMAFTDNYLLFSSFTYIVIGTIIAILSKLKMLNDKERVFLFTSGILTIFIGIYLNFYAVSRTALLSFTLVLSTYLFLLTEKKWIVRVSLMFITALFFKAVFIDIFENLQFSIDQFAFKDYTNLTLRIMEYFAVISALALSAKVGLRKNAKSLYRTAGFFTGLAMLAFLTYEASSVFYIFFKKGQSMGVSLSWVLFAAILFFIGLKKDKRWFKVSAFILFGVVLFKLFLIDIFSMSALYRVLTFLITGIVLIISSYIYYKFGKKA